MSPTWTVVFKYFGIIYAVKFHHKAHELDKILFDLFPVKMDKFKIKFISPLWWSLINQQIIEKYTDDDDKTKDGDKRCRKWSKKLLESSN